MRPVDVVVLLPFPQFGVEQLDVIGDPVGVQELIELLVIRTMGPLDLPVQSRRSRADVHMANIPSFQMPVKLRLKLCPIVGLNDVHPEG